MVSRTRSFAELLKRHRALAGLSQEELAERAGLGVRTVSDLERGVARWPYPETIALLARALGLDTAAWEALEASARRPRAVAAAAAPPPPGLPGYLTELLGRERDVAAIAHLLHRAERPIRLLTLTGPGGVGKTRLAVEVATAQQHMFDHGAVFVPLAALRDPTLVMGAIAEALGVGEGGGQPLSTLLHEALHDRHLLIVLDNFEQVAAAAPLVVDLLVACPRLTALVTSRAPLRVRGEHDYPVIPLAVSSPSEHLPGAAALAPAVELFAQRAQAVSPRFTLTPRDAETVGALCRRLGGLPLAIELAAAHTRMLAPDALLARLDRALPLLAGGARDLPERQQTMRSTIAWSYDLLDTAARALLRRLAVFAGGWTLEGAEAVGAGDDLERERVLALLEQLMDQSLVGSSDADPPEGSRSPGETLRFTMLEPIRQYAEEQLEGSGEADAVRRRHAALFVEFAEQAEPELWGGPHQTAWFGRLETEHDNLRAALRWSLDGAQAEIGLRLGAALWRFWWVRGHLEEGRRWLESGLARSRAPSALLRARALHGAGFLAFSQRDYERARLLLEQSLTLAREAQDTDRIVVVLSDLGDAARLQGDPGRATALLEESVALARSLGRTVTLAMSLRRLGFIAHAGGDEARAASYLETSLNLAREVGDRQGMAWALTVLGRVATVQAEYDRAADLFSQAWQLCNELGNRDALAYTVEGMASLMMARSRHSEGARRAARLYGAAAALRAAIKSPLPPVDRADYERNLAAARRRLEADAWTAAWLEGQALTLEEVAAQGGLRPLGPGS
jgi:predicted ATPase/DNA-binding XRE family transcriptional regulator